MSCRFNTNLASFMVLISMACFVLGLYSAGSCVDRLRLDRMALTLLAGFASVALSSLAFPLMSGSDNAYHSTSIAFMVWKRPIAESLIGSPYCHLTPLASNESSLLGSLRGIWASIGAQ